MKFEKPTSLIEALRFPRHFLPSQCAHLWLGLTLYPWQKKLLDDASEPLSRVARSMNNAAGKTSTIIPIFGLTCMAAFPGCHVYSTSGSEMQVKEQLFISYLQPIIANKPGWKISTAALTVDAPNGSRWVGYRCKKGGKVEGFHGNWEQTSDGMWRYRPVVYLVDEAKTVEDEIFQAIQRINPDFLLAVSTPGEERGWFYQAIDPDTLDDEGKQKQELKDMTSEEIEAKIKDREERLKELEAVKEFHAE